MQPAKLTRSLKAVAPAVLIAAICWYFGVDVWHAILLGCAITIAGLGLNRGASSADRRDLGWRRRDVRHTGSRNDVLNLSWSLRSGWGSVGDTADRRLMEIARRRLALEGLNLLDPAHRSAIEGRIGAAAYRVLVRTNRRRMSLGTLVYCLDALDAVDSAYYPPPHTRSRRSNWKLLPTRGRGTNA